MAAPSFRLLLITDRKAVPSSNDAPEAVLPDTISRALEGAPKGSVAVMLREKDLPAKDLIRLVEIMADVTTAVEAPLLVNDRVDVALACHACGVHLPSSGLPPRQARDLLGDDALIGVSTHGLEEARAAAAGGADYVTFGPLYDTPSKRPYGPPVGIPALTEVTEALPRPIPVYGLGGVTPERTPEVISAGAAGVACIRAVLAASDPAEAVHSFLKACPTARTVST